MARARTKREYGFLLHTETLKTNRRPTRIPLSIYVLWHPAFAEGPALASAVYDWFAEATSDARAVGMGIPVHFRSATWDPKGALTDIDGRSAENAPVHPGEVFDRRLDDRRRPIGLHHAEHNIFVPLVDDNMVDDPSWRRDLLELAAKHQNPEHRAVDDDDPVVHLAPIQLTPAWARLPEALTRIKALYLDRWVEALAPVEEPAERVLRWQTRLRRLLTQALVRLLRVQRGAPLTTEIFLSHAKIDGELGPGVAEEIRDTAAGYGQIDVFYDENDLPSGISWSERMLKRGAGAGAGFVAVMSDRYATRYWCRREVEEARTPQRADEARKDDVVWCLRPSVVAVTLMSRWTKMVPDLASVPTVAWKKGGAADVLDQVFREALVSEFHLRYARMLERRRHEVLAARDASQMPTTYITWTPDPPSVLRLFRLRSNGWKDGAIIAYPGHGFLPQEEEEITQSLGSTIRFVPFERFADAMALPEGATHSASAFAKATAAPPVATHPKVADWPRVALSAGDSEDLAALGYDYEPNRNSRHVDAVVLRFCRVVLEGGARLVYGGALRKGISFTSLLHDFVAAAIRVPQVAEANPATLLECLVAAPFFGEFDVSVRAKLAGLVRFESIGEKAPPDAGQAKTWMANVTSLALMRKEVAARTVATIALGGKRYNFAGLLPGVAEEILCATEHASKQKPLRDLAPDAVRVILIGEYGGAARAMARYILGRTDTIPEELTLNGHRAKLAPLLEHPEIAKIAKARYAALAACLAGLRGVAAMDDDTPLSRLGLTVGTWRALMNTLSPGFVRRTLKEQVLPRLVANGTSAPRKRKRERVDPRSRRRSPRS